MLAEAAGLVVKHEASAIAKALMQVLSDPETQQRLGEGCAKVTGRLGWNEPVEQMEALYQGLASAETLVAESQTGATS